MKKVKLFLLALLTVVLTSCNAQVFDFKYKFTKAHLLDEGKCVDIVSWANFDDGDMVQITLDDSNRTVVLGHSSRIILINGKCPYCN